MNPKDMQAELAEQAGNDGTVPLKPLKGYTHRVCGLPQAELFNPPNYGAVCWGCGGKTVPVEEVYKA